MEIKEIFGMTEGDGEFSYVHNSTTQGRIFSMMKPIIQNVIKLQLGENNDVMRRPCKALNVADLGCGIGPNPVALITLVIETVRQRSKELSLNEDQVPEIQIYLSDLPSNDFNNLFKNIAKLQANRRKDGTPLCLVMAAPGSFYDRLFPSSSMHIVHSNYALHWLSQVPLGLTDVSMPLNKNNIVATATSHPKVIKAYFDQFQQDFTAFLNYRSREIVPNGHIVLAIIGRSTVTLWQSPQHQFLLQALHNLVLKGVVEEEKLDSFNMPMYFPNKQEISSIVSQEGSFAIQDISVVTDDVEKHITDLNLKAEIVAKSIRSFSEALVTSHFGSQLWKMLQNELYQVVLTHLDSNHPIIMFNIMILLTRKMD